VNVQSYAFQGQSISDKKCLDCHYLPIFELCFSCSIRIHCSHCRMPTRLLETISRANGQGTVLQFTFNYTVLVIYSRLSLTTVVPLRLSPNQLAQSTELYKFFLVTLISAAAVQMLISNVDKRMQELKVPLYPYHDIINYTNNLIVFFNILWSISSSG